MGNCGFTLAPVRPGRPDLVVRNLERAEDISAEAMAQGIEWSWQHFSEYLDAVDRLPKGINYSGYIGHSALRTWAMGERAFEEEADEDDLRMMESELRAALRAGAMGFTTSRSSSHATSDDRPVASRLASWQEVRRLVAVMGQERTGIFEITPEDATRATGTPEQAEALDRLMNLSLESQRPVAFGVVPCPWYRELLELIDRTNAAGGPMFGQTHSRGTTLIMSFKTRLPFDNLPGWKDVRSLPLDDQRRALADPALRARLAAATDEAEYKPPVGPEVRKPDYRNLRVWLSPTPPNPLLADLARERRMHPVELLIEMSIESNFEQMFIQPTVAGAPQDPGELEAIMRHPNTVMTFSDAGAHVSQIADCSLQTHLLAYWVRQRQAFSIETAVQMLTSTPAQLWHFEDRGTLRPGCVADINIFDPDRVGPKLPTVESDLPGGAKRLRQHATGFLATLVGGQPVLRGGEATGATPGRLLRNGK
jgi:N-acyl-D-amino-acid deacylase